MKRAFTIIELLVTIAIIAILAAFIFPVFLSAKAAVIQMGAGRALKQYYTGTTLYAADHDDTFPIAMYYDGSRMVTWFGRQTDEDDKKFEPKGGLLSPYVKGKLGSDSTLIADPYLGDATGIGYNWGVIGSDMHIRNDYSTFPNCAGAATMSSLANPSKAAVFATSAFYNVGWRPGGDDRKYQFNFFDPMEAWNGVPNVDFRHMSQMKVNSADQVVEGGGNAVFCFGDGNVRSYPLKSVKSWWFWRDKPQD